MLNNEMTLAEALKIFWPLIGLNFVLVVWALVDLVRRKKVRYLPKVAWVAIILFVNLFGSIGYLTLGRSE